MNSKSTFSNSTSTSYAMALYELAKENSELDKVENQIKSLNQLLNENLHFKEIILSPTVAKQEKKNVMFAIANKNNFSTILKNFLGFITVKNRLFFLSEIIKSFLNLVSNKKGEIRAKVVSSKQLSTEEQKNIQKDLSGNFKHQIEIDYHYDPNLIAGLTIQVGSMMIDTSVKNKLKKLEKKMLET